MVLDLLPRIGLKPRDYLLKIVLPAVIASIILIIFGFMFFSGITLYLYLTLPIIILASAIGYPYIVLDSQKNKINERLHIFITKFGTLSITDLNRKDLLRILSEEKEELGELAKESEKLYVLTNTWGRSLAEACRFLAQRTPSSEFADFLDRLAYALDSGEELKEFLIKEQDIVMDDYAAFYRRMLYSLDLYKELYVSAMTSVAFFLAFSILVPYLIPYDFVFMATLALFAFFGVELLIVIVIKNKLPFDRLWHTGEKPTETDLMLRKWVIFSVILTIISLIFLAWAKYIGLSPFYKIPYMILTALGFTPLAIGGVVALREEEKVKRKESVFPDFLRSLGDSVSAKGGGMVESLEYLSNHDFGPLTKDIKRLYKRLALNIDQNKSWRFFGLESCSYLIQLFSDMFSRCIYFGGEPKMAAEIISNNFRKIVQLRKSKYQSVQQFAGVIYGLGGGLALALFASLGVAKMVSDLYTSLSIPETVIQILHIAPITDSKTVEYIIFGSLIVYSAISAVLIKIMDGGHNYVSLLHFVVILWICSIVAYITKLIVSQILGLSVPIY
ncbi:archaellar assembly protein FlaJ [Methanocaldococcus fervens]|uniref:Type II secretion system F domain protein n=1 Tax=Methanocaldococcus fervens (strain DSM 4213 / JCM 15782 / AG86) TaxID=573064 RepID=C7P8Y2_METFA|nr:archaellar assembly protein FlaJ [Methanocaldococcus fervens]ACV25014.1 Type II secretion system F domain protein [Methanocaldococcus fervens AG86]